MSKKPPPHGDLRYLVGAAALVVVVAVLALAFGIVRPPALEGLTDAQRAALPGGVAWTEFNDRDGCTDLMVADPSDGAKSVVCHEQLDRVVGWTEDGIVTVAWTDNGENLQTRDPATGEVLSSRDLGGYVDQPKDEADDAGFTTDRVDGKLVLANRYGSVVWETEADARYEIGSISVSPDDRWVAMTDSAERLLVVRTDGSEEPAIWATGVREWSWRPVIWEGTEPLA
jgi:hypothetical protein